MPPVESFGPGPLFQCRFRIQPGGRTRVRRNSTTTCSRLEIADPTANKFNAQITGGAIEIQPRGVLATTQNMCPEGTSARAATCKPIVACSRPDGRPAGVPPDSA